MRDARLGPVSRAQVTAGVLAAAGFLLPWTHGPGKLAGETYSGLELVRLAGILGGLEQPTSSEALLLGLRALVVAVPVAAAWITVLGLAAPTHRVAAVAGAYLVAAASALALRTVAEGDLLPPPGAGLMFAAGAVVALSWVVGRVPRAQTVPETGPGTLDS